MITQTIQSQIHMIAGPSQVPPAVDFNDWKYNVIDAFQNFIEFSALSVAMNQVRLEASESAQDLKQDYLSVRDEVNINIALIVDDPALGMAVFGEKREETLELLKKIKLDLQSFQEDIRELCKMGPNSPDLESLIQSDIEALVKAIVQLEILIQKSDPHTINRFALNPGKSSQIPGFPEPKPELRMQTESFGDRYISQQSNPLIVTPDGRVLVQANIPSILQHPKTPTLGALPGRASMHGAADAPTSVRIDQARPPMFVPRNASDWLLIPLIPSFAPGVSLRVFTHSAKASPLLRFLIQAPVSLILMLSGIETLTKNRNPARADGII